MESSFKTILKTWAYHLLSGVVNWHVYFCYISYSIFMFTKALFVHNNLKYYIILQVS